jgi:hypothetical protein
MTEGYVNLFIQEDYAGTNRPHYKGFMKIDGVDHEFALWPNREGKKGFSGKYKPKQFVEPSEPAPQPVEAAPNAAADSEIPF